MANKLTNKLQQWAEFHLQQAEMNDDIEATLLAFWKKLHKALPGTKAIAVGSRPTSLASENSDYDYMIVNYQKSAVEKLYQAVKKLDLPNAKATLIKATVPVVRVSLSEKICVDLMTERNAVFNCQLVRDYVTIWPTLPEVYVILKRWRDVNGLKPNADRSHYGIKSHVLLLMIVHFLQEKHDLPCLQEEMPDRYDLQVTTSFVYKDRIEYEKVIHNDVEIQTLIRQFFDFYVDFKFSEKKIRIDKTCVTLRNPKDQYDNPDSYPLYVLEPFAEKISNERRKRANCARNLPEKEYKIFIQALEATAQKLQPPQKLSVQLLFDPVTPPAVTSSSQTWESDIDESRTASEKSSASEDEEVAQIFSTKKQFKTINELLRSAIGKPPQQQEASSSGTRRVKRKSATPTAEEQNDATEELARKQRKRTPSDARSNEAGTSAAKPTAGNESYVEQLNFDIASDNGQCDLDELDAILDEDEAVQAVLAFNEKKQDQYEGNDVPTDQLISQAAEKLRKLPQASSEEQMTSSAATSHPNTLSTNTTFITSSVTDCRQQENTSVRKQPRTFFGIRPRMQVAEELKEVPSTYILTQLQDLAIDEPILQRIRVAFEHERKYLLSQQDQKSREEKKLFQQFQQFLRQQQAEEQHWTEQRDSGSSESLAQEQSQPSAEQQEQTSRPEQPPSSNVDALPAVEDEDVVFVSQRPISGITRKQQHRRDFLKAEEMRIEQKRKEVERKQKEAEEAKVEAERLRELLQAEEDEKHRRREAEATQSQQATNRTTSWGYRGGSSRGGSASTRGIGTDRHRSANHQRSIDNDHQHNNSRQRSNVDDRQRSSVDNQQRSNSRQRSSIDDHHRSKSRQRSNEHEVSNTTDTSTRSHRASDASDTSGRKHQTPITSTASNTTTTAPPLVKVRQQQPQKPPATGFKTNSNVRDESAYQIQSLREILYHNEYKKTERSEQLAHNFMKKRIDNLQIPIEDKVEIYQRAKTALASIYDEAMKKHKDYSYGGKSEEEKHRKEEEGFNRNIKYIRQSYFYKRKMQKKREACQEQGRQFRGYGLEQSDTEPDTYDANRQSTSNS